MQLGRLTSIAASAIHLETRRLAQSAANVANLNTENYEPQHVTGRAAAQGGVEAVTYTRGGGLQPTAASGTDLVEETATQIGGLRAFQANLAVLRTADEMLGELVKRTA